mmetsp:Transcript_27424/g.64503  ORF Transcript_27424/g.64503 Transcript_27424/m.64503 type:complete len:388 (-) Transcript_27424:731-1894(-)
MRHCSVLAVILGIHVRTHLEEQHGGLHVPACGRHMDWRLLLDVLDVDICTPLKKTANAIHIVIGGCHVERSPSLCVCGVDFDTVGVEELHQIVTLVLGDNVEGGLPLVGLGGQVGSATIAKLRQAHVSGMTGILQQGLLSQHISRIDLGCLQQSLEHVHKNRAIPCHDLLEIESLELFSLRLESSLQIREGIWRTPRLGVLGADLGRLLRRLRRRRPVATSVLPLGGVRWRRAHSLRWSGFFRNCLEGRGKRQVGSYGTVLHRSCINGGVRAQQEDLHQCVLHLAERDLVHHVEGNFVGASVFHLRVLCVMQEAPQGPHHLRHKLRSTRGQAARARHGLLHLAEECFWHWRCSCRHQSLVALQVEKVQGHKLLRVLSLHHSCHEVSH